MRERRELLLWAWAVPFFLLTASFEVRFPRYLLPLYPVLLLAAGAPPRAARRRAGGPAIRAPVVLGLSGAYLLAFLSIYARPHSIVSASEWFHENVGPGRDGPDAGLGGGLPLLPPRPPLGPVPLREPGPLRARQPREDAASSRIGSPRGTSSSSRRSGSTAPSRRPASASPTPTGSSVSSSRATSATPLVRTFSSPPQLLGLRLPSELADESFSVYDHPKAVVFRNAARLDAGELERRLRESTPSRALSRTDLLLARPDDPHADSERADRRHPLDAPRAPPLGHAPPGPRPRGVASPRLAPSRRPRRLRPLEGRRRRALRRGGLGARRVAPLRLRPLLRVRRSRSASSSSAPSRAVRRAPPRGARSS